MECSTLGCNGAQETTMIIGENFLWLHLPKTGGTTMNGLFRDLEITGIHVDRDSERKKHDSIELREQSGCWRAGDRQRFITIRRLDQWLLSDWKHKRRHYDLADLPWEPVRHGLFYSLRLGGVWVAADWWLQYFGVNEDVIALRLEALVDDFNQKLLPFLPNGTLPLQQLELRLNAAPGQQESDASFTLGDLQTIQAVNPRWNAWQERWYSKEELPGWQVADASESAK